MKKQLKKIIAAIIIITTAFQMHSCAKEAEEPEAVCKTCIARDKLEGAPVDNERVCSDEAEKDFRNENADSNVTCE